MLIVSPRIHLPDHEFTLTFSRSSGKGGQNVNKVSSKATLRWSPAKSSLSGEVKERFIKKFSHRLTSDGDLLLHSDRHRSQSMNIEDCFEKLSEMIQSVEFQPIKRKKTKPSKSQKKKRLESKKKDSVKKDLRKKVRL